MAPDGAVRAPKIAVCLLGAVCGRVPPCASAVCVLVAVCRRVRPCAAVCAVCAVCILDGPVFLQQVGDLLDSLMIGKDHTYTAK